jgi:hypothetical protein
MPRPPEFAFPNECHPDPGLAAPREEAPANELRAAGSAPKFPPRKLELRAELLKEREADPLDLWLGPLLIRAVLRGSAPRKLPPEPPRGPLLARNPPPEGRPPPPPPWKLPPPPWKLPPPPP